MATSRNRPKNSASLASSTDASQPERDAEDRARRGVGRTGSGGGDSEASKSRRATRSPSATKRRKKASESGPSNAPAFRNGREVVDAFFASKNWTPWAFQLDAWDAFARGESGVITVATGAGKTYAAYMGPFAAMVDRVLAIEQGLHADQPLPGPWLLYLSPLKSVARDVELALSEPIRFAQLPIRIESRTGDTSASVRAKQKQRLPEVLITTPESLSLLLTRDEAPAAFAGLMGVIVDEWHELLASKRGTQVELALARLRRFAPSLRTWAMSATIANIDDAANAVVGTHRPSTLVRGEMERPTTIDAILPRNERSLPWCGHLGLSMVPAVLEELDPRVPTILFTNTRSQAERWFGALMAARPELESVSALHHGSLDRDDRHDVETGLKAGTTRLVVATSSLDLGVDFEPIERVIQIGSPKGVGRLLQRAGRASHRPRAACRISCVPTHALELIEIAAAREAALAGKIEARPAPDKPLDVLAQHLVTCALGGGFMPDDLFDEVRTAHAYRALTRQEFDWALALVREGGGTLKAYAQYHKIALNEHGMYRGSSPKLAQLHRLNIGTITGDATLDIRYMTGKSLGRIEEHFVAHLREGERFVFAGKVLKFVTLRDLVCYVQPATGSTNHTPIWSGTRLPISESLAEGIRETLERAAAGDRWCPELHEADALIRVQQRESIVPVAHESLAEILRSREGTHLFLFPFEGRLVNAGLGALMALRLTRHVKATFAVAANDYGVELLCPDAFDFESLLTPSLFTRDSLAEDAVLSANLSQLAKLQFREIARVAGLVFQTYPGTHKTGKQLQANSSLIFDVLNDFDKDNMLLHQARREVLDRHFEQSRLGRTLDRIAGQPIRIVNISRPTPLSFPLVIERQSAKLSSETILERVERMRDTWEREDLGVGKDSEPTAKPVALPRRWMAGPRRRSND